MNVGNLVLTLGFMLIIVFSITSFYTYTNVMTGNEDFLQMNNLNYEEYMDLYDTEHTGMSGSGTQITDLGDLVFGQGYSTIKNVFDGSWLVITTNLLITSLGLAPIDSVIIGVLITMIGLTFLFVVIGALMNRYLIGRN